MFTPALIAALMVLLLVGLSTPLVISLFKRFGVLDIPVARSSHSVPTVRGGGLALVLPLSAAVWWSLQRDGNADILVAAAVLGYALLGLIDDLRSLRASTRFVGQLLLAFAAMAGLEAPIPLIPVGALLIVAVVNAYNFMDGINGISAITSTITGVAYGVLGLWAEIEMLAIIGLSTAGAALGFLPFNFPAARVFLGDVGSYLLGSILGISCVIAMNGGVPIVAAAAPLAIYGFDTATTLSRRVSRGDSFHEAHREHVYQRVADLRSSHSFASLLAGTWIFLAVAGGAVSVRNGLGADLIAALLVAAAGLGYLLSPKLLGRSA